MRSVCQVVEAASFPPLPLHSNGACVLFLKVTGQSLSVPEYPSHLEHCSKVVLYGDSHSFLVCLGCSCLILFFPKHRTTISTTTPLFFRTDLIGWVWDSGYVGRPVIKANIVRALRFEEEVEELLVVSMKK